MLEILYKIMFDLLVLAVYHFITHYCNSQFWKKKMLRTMDYVLWTTNNFVIWERVNPCLGRVNPFPNKPWFLHVCSTSLLKTLWEKEKLLVTSNFSFSRSVFYPFEELSAIFIKFKIVVCKHFWVWKSLKFIVWERVKAIFCELVLSTNLLIM